MTEHRLSLILLLLVLGVYVVLATQYAYLTPKWQAPDEPAHYNYVQFVARENRLPVLESGDYPFDYLEQIKSARFPESMSIAPIRYEFHQPPAYYILASVVARMAGNAGRDPGFYALRLFSVVQGCAVLVLTYRLTQYVLPGQNVWASLSAAMVALVPMHLSMTAAINNDTLGELVLLLVLLQSLKIASHGGSISNCAVLGVLLGLAAWTKTTIYLPSAASVLAIWIAPSRGQVASSRHRMLCTATIILVASAAALPLFVRNVMVYGRWDMLGWQRHDSIVAGQLRTSDLLQQIGWPAFLSRFVQTTYRSFWAQFGWMAVTVDERIYWALGIFSAVIGAGVGALAIRVRRSPALLASDRGRALTVLISSVVLSIVTYLAYNFKFVQHQGRYLFTALPTIAIVGTLGMRELTRPAVSRTLAVLLVVATAVLTILAAWRGYVPRTTIAMLAATALWLCSLVQLPPKWRWAPVASICLGLVALAWTCLYQYIIPYLS
jgi:hypothetical protein